MDYTSLIGVSSFLRAEERETIYSAAPHTTRVRSIPKLHLNPASSAVASKELLEIVRTEKASNGIFLHMLFQHPCICRSGTSQFRFVIFPFNLCLVTTISTIYSASSGFTCQRNFYNTLYSLLRVGRREGNVRQSSRINSSVSHSHTDQKTVYFQFLSLKQSTLPSALASISYS